MFFLRINLQAFAGEKTEKATPKKRKKAREEGQVLQSREINSALILLFTFYVMRLMGSYYYRNITVFTKNIFLGMKNSENLFTANEIHKLFILTVILLGKMVVPIVGTAFVVGLICSYMQVGILFTTKSLFPKFSRINPINGFKKFFSLKPLIEFFKSLVKLSAVGYITFSYVMKQSKNMINILDMDILQIVGYLGNITVNIGLRAAIVLIILAILDYYYQKWEYEKDLRMSKQEIKEEYKQTEGDPQVRSKIKEKQRQMSMSRMMQDVPKADVIITNPTHYAVAIRYDSKLEDAPVVLAKGKDLIAQKIKEVAKENNVIIIENKMLARGIYFAVDIGDYIPPDLYQAVAEVLAYVYRIKNIY
ncbi:flagellar biosynthesis protein FlhB [Crassaminicella thermophila]|uniref:Flagellar biosynthetic protein FlhB n=1 Tax=Crassaminicella thermophila TaxID=2599308 RepID=A0A5C0SH02_CRATE|nr:flagellar biosynthesis protein FlhB [Crassaminicella thermophila]QEK12259.1 flagellar biosynthesis protein FlhB [Crassaminicella thermophila]